MRKLHGRPGSSPDVPLLIAGLAGAAASTKVVALYNGKIDAPQVWARPLSDAECASPARRRQGREARRSHWDFAAGITRDGIGTDAVRDVSGQEF